MFEGPAQGIINFHIYNDKNLSIKGDVTIENNEGNSKLRISIDRVKLKNNIWLNDLKLMFKCNNSMLLRIY